MVRLVWEMMGRPWTASHTDLARSDPSPKVDNPSETSTLLSTEYLDNGGLQMIHIERLFLFSVVTL